MSLRTVVFAASMLLTARLAMAEPELAAKVDLGRHDDRVTVTIDGAEFTSYRFTGHDKPILYPLRGPGGVPLTRSWPIEKGVAGEPEDHPHHESLWFTHGSVNGHDFWAPRAHGAGPDGPIPHVEHVSIDRCESGETAILEATSRWVDPDGQPVLTEHRTMVFSADETARSIDVTLKLVADSGPVTFGDTKEGSFALRVRPALQPKDSNGSQGAGGRLVNSEGLVDGAAWGKRARWVDYSGTVDGKAYGIAMLDHPANLRHPTWWHAREYGLSGANPFGIHDFSGEPEGAGNHTIPPGETLVLRYLVVFHEGDAGAAEIDRRWKRWTEETSR
ncbi:MAG: PmoA family protein [Planctomycetia bacterium]